MIWEQLHLAIDDVHLCINLLDLELLVDEELSNMMIPHLYVIHFLIVKRVPHDVNCTL